MQALPWQIAGLTLMRSCQFPMTFILTPGTHFRFEAGNLAQCDIVVHTP
jgi:hypothetical protein